MTRNQFIEQATLIALCSGSTGFEAVNKATAAAHFLEKDPKFKFDSEVSNGFNEPDVK